MNEIDKEFFELISQIRIHVELQRALGLTVIEVSPDVPASVGSTDQPAPLVQPPPKAKALPEKKPVEGPPREVPAAVADDVNNCVQCKRSTIRKACVPGEGNRAAKIVFIGDAPVLDGTGQGKSIAGDAGQLLTDIIVKGMQLKREEVYICTLVQCAAPGTAPEPDEIAACQPRLIKQMKTIKPDIIIALGDLAAQTLAGREERLSTLHGKWHEWQGFKVMPTYSPEYLLQNPSDKKIVWEDIKKVLAEMSKEKKSTGSGK